MFTIFKKLFLIVTMNEYINKLNIIENQLKQYELNSEVELVDKHKLHRDYIVKYDFGDVDIFRDVSLCDDKIFKFEFGTYSVNRGKKNVAFKFKVYLEDVAKLCGDSGVSQFTELVNRFKKISEKMQS